MMAFQGAEQGIRRRLDGPRRQFGEVVPECMSQGNEILITGLVTVVVIDLLQVITVN